MLLRAIKYFVRTELGRKKRYKQKKKRLNVSSIVYVLLSK